MSLKENIPGDVLRAQVERERIEIESAPPVGSTGIVGRCHWCGRVARSLVLVERVDGVDRYKCEVCRGEGF